MSSLGEFDNGKKRALWKYWDEHGRLKAEVTYGANGNRCVYYYASGQKKAVGAFTPSGKIGQWTYWDQNGKAIAHCDFGEGVFAISGGGCEMIAAELSPKGYSRPIPRGAAGNDGRVSLTVGPQVFEFMVPPGWVADLDSGREDKLPLVFHPKGKKWRDAGANMYLRVFFKNGRSFSQVVKDDEDNFEQSVSDYHEHYTKNGRLPSGFAFILDVVTYKPVIQTDSPFSIVASNQVHDQAAYLDVSNQIVLLLDLTTDTQQEMLHATPAFESILHSAR